MWLKNSLEKLSVRDIWVAAAITGCVAYYIWTHGY